LKTVLSLLQVAKNFATAKHFAKNFPTAKFFAKDFAVGKFFATLKSSFELHDKAQCPVMTFIKIPCEGDWNNEQRTTRFVGEEMKMRWS
jgi:hypothetical protein